MDILSVVTRVPILVFGVERNDDDFADRINYKYTVAVLVIFAIIVTNRQFGTKQIHCWIPAYFTRNYEEYINDICWVSNTYYISLDQKLPEAEHTRKSFELKYYQWVPFILLSQAFFFYIPHIAWRALSRRSGIDIRDIVEAASNYKSVDKYENRQKYMSYMLTAVDQYVDDPRRRKESRRISLRRKLISVICFASGKFLGNYLMVLYLFIKLAFIANCICQLFILNLLLGHEFHKFGFELMDKILNGKGWDTGSRIFPKISMCDFRIREVGNPKVSHRYTVQCVLPINLFNQQIFTFIWFWYTIVLLVNIYSLIVWTYRFLPSKRLRYIMRRIKIMRQALFYRSKNLLDFNQTSIEMQRFENEIISQFVHDYLESDGLFILRVLSSNTSDFVCTELIQELWKYFRKHRKFNRKSNNRSDNENDDDDDDEDEENENSDQDNNKKEKHINEEMPTKKSRKKIQQQLLQEQQQLQSQNKVSFTNLNDNNKNDNVNESVEKNVEIDDDELNIENDNSELVDVFESNDDNDENIRLKNKKDNIKLKTNEKIRKIRLHSDSSCLNNTVTGYDQNKNPSKATNNINRNISGINKNVNRFSQRSASISIEPHSAPILQQETGENLATINNRTRVLRNLNKSNPTTNSMTLLSSKENKREKSNSIIDEQEELIENKQISRTDQELNKTHKKNTASNSPVNTTTSPSTPSYSFPNNNNNINNPDFSSMLYSKEEELSLSSNGNNINSSNITYLMTTTRTNSILTSGDENNSERSQPRRSKKHNDNVNNETSLSCKLNKNNNSSSNSDSDRNNNSDKKNPK